MIGPYSWYLSFETNICKVQTLYESMLATYIFQMNTVMFEFWIWLQSHSSKKYHAMYDWLFTFSKEVREAKIDPPFQTLYIRSGGEKWSHH